MKSEIDKSTFKQERQYPGVAMQQGRALLDEDQNETATKSEEKSIIVVADTHFGLYSDSEICDPNAFADFLNWIKNLEEGKNKELKIGAFGSADDEPTLILEPPEKIIFLGDILELWTGSNEAIFASTTYIMKLLSELNCEKIYVLGNHDYDLLYSITREEGKEIKYPLGTSDITITEKEYWVSKGGENYCFLHGQQFDKLFALPSWKFMAPIRKAALAFGNYTLVLVFLCLANFIVQTIMGIWGVADIVITLLLTIFSLPYSVLFFSRKIWNHFKTIKFNPDSMQEKYAKKRLALWEKFSKKMTEETEILNVIYGHTHTIDHWQEEEFVERNGELVYTLLDVSNIPSWIEITSNEIESIENESSHIFLYVAEYGSFFIGWDRIRKKPYLIPKEVIIHKRKHGNLSEFKKQYGMVLINRENIEQRLTEIDWPKELVQKWMTGFKTD